MLRSLCVLGLIASAPAAQVPLSGDVYDGHGGPLQSDVVYVTSGFRVPAGQVLTAWPGAIVKFDGGNLVLDGRLSAPPGDGSEAQRFVLTSIRDDSKGGDTNGDGDASKPGPGAWGNVVLNPGSKLELESSELRYYGGGNTAGIEVTTGDVDLGLSGTFMRHGDGAGVDFHGHYVLKLGIHECHFEGNAGAAIVNVDINDIGYHPGVSTYGIRSNHTVGNGRNSIEVTALTLVQNVLWNGYDLDGGVLVLSGPCVVTNGATLSLIGSVVKFPDGAGLEVVNGGLDLVGFAVDLGQGSGPTVLTALADDTWGGDTNGDGTASAPVAGAWRGVSVSAGPVHVDHAKIRYAGQLAGDAALSLTVATGVTRLLVEHCAGDGLILDGVSGNACADLVAWDCAGTGITLGPSVGVLKRATVTGCGTGIAATSATNEVRSSVAWHNGQNWSGLDGRVHWSDGPGSVGGTGNVAGDPLFVDESRGDFRLASGSPCIDAGEPADAPGNLGGWDEPGDLDPAGQLRLIDGDLDTVRTVDMGAYEFDNVELQVTGLLEPGGTIEIRTTMHAPFTQAFLVVNIFGATTQNLLPHYGVLWIWVEDDALLLPWPAASSLVSTVIPPDVQPSAISFQVGARVAGSPGAPGNLSNFVLLPPPP